MQHWHFLNFTYDLGTPPPPSIKGLHTSVLYYDFIMCSVYTIIYPTPIITVVQIHNKDLPSWLTLMWTTGSMLITSEWGPCAMTTLSHGSWHSSRPGTPERPQSIISADWSVSHVTFLPTCPNVEWDSFSGLGFFFSSEWLGNGTQMLNLHENLNRNPRSISFAPWFLTRHSGNDLSWRMCSHRSCWRCARKRFCMHFTAVNGDRHPNAITLGDLYGFMIC